MVKRILKSKWFWLVVLLVSLGVALYSYGIPNLLYYWDRIFNPPKDITLEEALQEQITKDWDYTTDPVTANVVSSDLEAGTLLLSFVWPPGFIRARFGGETPPPNQTVEITCPKEESGLYATRVPKDLQTSQPMETKLLESKIDIVSTAQSGDSLIGLCANEECTEINRFCQLNRTFIVEE